MSLDPNLIGRVLENRYRLVRWIGGGGFADVYEAERLRLGDRVAVKIVTATTEEFAKQVATEAKLHCQFHHDNVVQVIDTGVDGSDLAYIVMEFLEGKTLAHCEPLSRTQVIQLVRQICGALEAAHDRSLVHRDLKLENIMLVGDGTPEGCFKILDFGIATQVNTEATRRNFLMDGAGTVSNMAPEQISGSAGLKPTPKFDIYSFGIVLYEILTGKKPFPADGVSLATLTYRVVHDDPPTFAEVAPDKKFPRGLEELILQCLSKDPARRPKTIRDVKERFLSLYEGQTPSSTRNRGLVPQPDAPSGDSWWGDGFRWVAYPMIFFVILLLGGVALWTERGRELRKIHNFVNSKHYPKAVKHLYDNHSRLQYLLYDTYDFQVGEVFRNWADHWMEELDHKVGQPKRPTSEELVHVIDRCREIKQELKERRAQRAFSEELNDKLDELNEELSKKLEDPIARLVIDELDTYVRGDQFKKAIEYLHDEDCPPAHFYRIDELDETTRFPPKEKRTRQILDDGQSKVRALATEGKYLEAVGVVKELRGAFHDDHDNMLLKLEFEVRRDADADEADKLAKNGKFDESILKYKSARDLDAKLDESRSIDIGLKMAKSYLGLADHLLSSGVEKDKVAHQLDEALRIVNLILQEKKELYEAKVTCAGLHLLRAKTRSDRDLLTAICDLKHALQADEEGSEPRRLLTDICKRGYKKVNELVNHEFDPDPRRHDDPTFREAISDASIAIVAGEVLGSRAEPEIRQRIALLYYLRALARSRLSSPDARGAIEDFETFDRFAVSGLRPLDSAQALRLLAEILATCKDRTLRDAKRALGLVEKAKGILKQPVEIPQGLNAAQTRKFLDEYEEHCEDESNLILRASAYAHAASGNFGEAVMVMTVVQNSFLPTDEGFQKANDLIVQFKKRIPFVDDRDVAASEAPPQCDSVESTAAR